MALCHRCDHDCTTVEPCPCCRRTGVTAPAEVPPLTVPVPPVVVPMPMPVLPMPWSAGTVCSRCGQWHNGTHVCLGNNVYGVATNHMAIWPPMANAAAGPPHYDVQATIPTPLA